MEVRPEAQVETASLEQSPCLGPIQSGQLLRRPGKWPVGLLLAPEQESNVRGHPPYHSWSWDEKRPKCAKNNAHQACRELSLRACLMYLRLRWSVNTIKGCQALSNQCRHSSNPALIASSLRFPMMMRSDGINFLKKMAQELNFSRVPYFCNSMAPMPTSEASTFTMNGRSGFDHLRIGVLVNLPFSRAKACQACGVNAMFFLCWSFNKSVSSAATELKPWINRL